ncbi:MAG: histidinol dehydrogenase [Phycisphaerales bacterium]|nr:histidinol dehydrogenase [Phycisphaerales bacterium]
MDDRLLRLVQPQDVLPSTQSALDEETLRAAGVLIAAVRQGGMPALRRLAEEYDGLAPAAPLVYDRAMLAAVLARQPAELRGLLERTADRIRNFAAAQRHCLRDLDVAVPGGRAGHTVAPMESAGCYAPGGRFPLPSSVLMTAVTARVAGVEQVVVASPRPTDITLAAAAVADADMLLAAGGAQAIAALAYGAPPVPPCSVVVGPGNRWVTAAKQLIAGTVAIDMLAGPSELLVIADAGADPAMIAADLLAQAEHDPDARPLLVTWHRPLIPAVEVELAAQLADLPTADTARQALTNGIAVIVSDAEEATEISDRIAPEHLALHVQDPQGWRGRLRHYGALFEGAAAAEVLGDYGIGPNHVLPTGGAARIVGGLSIFHFLRVRTWLGTLGVTDPDGAELRGVIRDAEALARLEGLEAHARSAARRSS